MPADITLPLELPWCNETQNRHHNLYNIWHPVQEFRYGVLMAALILKTVNSVFNLMVGSQFTNKS